MNRKSLIILNAGVGEDFCRGVKIDGKNFKRFLTSARGGAWRDDEIEIIDFTNYTSTFLSPKEKLLVKLSQIKISDYAFVVFSGHGHMNSYGETCFNLGNNNEICDTEIKHFLPEKSTLIMDCCRKKPKTELRILAETRNLTNFSKRGSTEERLRLREKFDKLVSDALPCPIYIYSCAPDQYSRDTSEGGLFSKNFIKSAEESYKDLSVLETFYLAELRVISEDAKQTPNITMARTGPYFPFAVV